MVEVVQNLAGLGLVAYPGLDVEHRLRVGRNPEPGAAQLVDHGNEFRAADFVDLVKMAAHVGQLELALGIVWVEPCLVELAAHADQVGQHRVADRARDHCVRQSIQADIDDAALAHHRHPVEDGPLVGRVEIVRADQLAHGAGGQLFQERPQAGDDLLVEAALVAEGRRQAREHFVLDLAVLDPQVHGHQLGLAVLQAAGHGRPAFLTQLGFDAGHLVAPVDVLALCRQLVEHHFGIVQEQAVNAGHVLQQRLVGRDSAKRDLRLGHDVREAPGEFLKGSRVTRGGQGVGSAGGHLGDAREVADAVVARGNLRVAQVEQVELVQSAGALGLRIHAQHQVGIALRVDHDGDLAGVDVLRGQHLQ